MGWAKGIHAIGICDRCSFQYPYRELQKEQGTRLMVCPECNDGAYNRVDHPQNKPPRKIADDIALKNPRPAAEEETIGWLLINDSDSDDGSYLLQEDGSKILTEGTQ